MAADDIEDMRRKWNECELERDDLRDVIAACAREIGGLEYDQDDEREEAIAANLLEHVRALKRDRDRWRADALKYMVGSR